MNVLIYNTKQWWGGIVTEDEIIIKGLRQRGHKVVIVARPGSKYALQSAYKDELILFKAGADFNPISIFRLVRLIKKHKIDIIVTNTEKEVTIGGVAAKLCGIPNIRRVGSAGDLSYHRRYFYIMENFLITHNLMPSDYVFNNAYLTNKKIERKNYTTVYTGKDVIPYTSDDIHNLRKNWGIQEGEIVLGITCQLSVVKAIPDLINVFSRLCKTYDNLRLVITGEGGQKESLQALVKDLHLQHKVIFAGYSKTPQLTASAYDICLHTSLHEGMGIAIFEYMTANKPIIVSDVGGIKEILSHGESYLMYAPGDLDTLYNHIVTVLTQPEFAHKLSENAFTTIQRYTTERFVTQIESIFLQYIKGRR